MVDALKRPDTPALTEAKSSTTPGQGFRALTERWTVERVERVVALLHSGDRAALAAYLEAHVPRVPHSTDPPGQLDLKGLAFDVLDYRVDLGQVKFEGLNLWNATFANVNLKGAQFRKCALGQARFEGAYMRGAAFADCDLKGVDFLRANLQHVKFENTDLYFATWVDCEIDVRSFASGLKEEHTKKWGLAAGVYKALRLNLNAAGDNNGASWAAYRQSINNRRDLFGRKKFWRWVISLGLDVLWGYGERPSRLFLFSVLLATLYGLAYFFTGVKFDGTTCTVASQAPERLSHLGECLYYSFITFTTVGYGDITPCGAFSRLLAASEALAGIFTMGLFVTANARKLEGR